MLTFEQNKVQPLDILELKLMGLESRLKTRIREPTVRLLTHSIFSSCKHLALHKIFEKQFFDQNS